MAPLASALAFVAPALPYLKRFALPIGVGIGVIAIYWIAHARGDASGFERGHAEGVEAGISQGRKDLAAEYERQSIEHERQNAEAVRQAEREVRDEIERLRRDDGTLDPDGLRALCAGDANCDPARLLGEPDTLGAELPAPSHRRYPRAQSRARPALPEGD